MIRVIVHVHHVYTPPSSVVSIYIIMQIQRDILPTEVDGKLYENLVSARGEEWRKRRSVLSPAFSGHKMRLVSFQHVCIQLF